MIRREYGIWWGMVARCEDPRQQNYDRYGGRGIKVCDKWRGSFAAFLADLGPRPSREHTIDRIDNNGNYEPGNVRWATRIEQANNKRTSRTVTALGRTLTMSQWARETGIKRTALDYRINRGWSPDAALTRPLRANRRRVTP
jgi:hypothetical protein